MVRSLFTPRWARTITIIVFVWRWRGLVAQQADLWPECELKCRNGGSCVYVSNKPDILLRLIQRGDMIQKCLCPPEYAGLGCEIPLSLCRDNDTTDDCVQNIAYNVSSFAGQMSTNVFAEYCSQDLGATRFCLHGGKCSSSFQSNVFDDSRLGCVCPSVFAGPHCEFLRLSSSSGMDGDDAYEVTDSVPTPAPVGGYDAPATADDLTDDRAPENNETSHSVSGSEASKSGGQTSTYSSSQSPNWSILSGFGGVAIVTVLFVLYRLAVARHQEYTTKAPPDSFIIPSLSRTRFLKVQPSPAAQAISESVHDAQLNTGCSTAHRDWYHAIKSHSVRYWTSIFRRREMSYMSPVSADPSRSHKNASPTSGHSSMLESEALSGQSYLDDSDIEIMIGTFDHMQQFASTSGPTHGSCGSTGGACDIPIRQNRSRRTASLVQETYRQRLTSLHSLHLTDPDRVYSGEQGTLGRETSTGADESTQGSDHSSYTDQPSTYFAHWSAPKRMQPRPIRMCSPNETSLYSSDCDSGPSIVFTGAASSFSDYSSFPDSTTATSLRTWDLRSSSDSEELSSTMSSSWSDSHDDDSGSSLSF